MWLNRSLSKCRLKAVRQFRSASPPPCSPPLFSLSPHTPCPAPSTLIVVFENLNTIFVVAGGVVRRRLQPRHGCYRRRKAVHVGHEGEAGTGNGVAGRVSWWLLCQESICLGFIFPRERAWGSCWSVPLGWKLVVSFTRLTCPAPYNSESTTMTHTPSDLWSRSGCLRWKASESFTPLAGSGTQQPSQVCAGSSRHARFFCFALDRAFTTLSPCVVLSLLKEASQLACAAALRSTIVHNL